jgi:hypothetical protein
MSTTTKASKQAASKPGGKVTNVRRRRQDRLQRFDRIMIVVFGVMGLVLVVQAI